MAVIAFVPVREGSKSIPLKNIKLFCGRPLVYWCLKALELTSKVDKIIIATDSKIIADTVIKFGFSKVSIYKRLPENATDTASTESVILEYLDNTEVKSSDYLMLVQATSPLTCHSDFEGAINYFFRSKYDSLLSCVRLKRFFWNEDGSSLNYDYVYRPRRQDFKGNLMENGAFYINKIENILIYKNRLSGKIGIYEMPEYTAIEIDELDDWNIAEKLMLKHILNLNKKKNKIKLFITDVDGVLTDSGMYYSENGDEMKKFNTKDGMGIQMLAQKGVKIAIITSENTKLVERRAKKLNVNYLYQSKKYGGKLDAAIDICKKEGITLENVAYIGDDLNCLELLSNVGLAACPIDAIRIIKEIPNIMILNKKGGEGAVRELSDYIIENNLFDSK